MANHNLTKAKRAKNDEFYTQYPFIQKEIEAYLEYDPHTFRNKVIYCNCDDPYESNFFRYFVLNFRKLGLKQLITTSFEPSPVANTQLKLWDATNSKKRKGGQKVTAIKFIINKVGDFNGDGKVDLVDIAKQLKAKKENDWVPLEGNGDFRSDECIKILKVCDIIVTNPPFSLFRQYVKQLVECRKKFIIIGNINAITYKEIFPLIQLNRLWLGATANSSDMVFAVPEGSKVSDSDRQKAERLGYKGNFTRLGNSCWFTNLDHGRRHQKLPLMTIKENKKYSSKIKKNECSYQQYDNYDAIEVPYTEAIPRDYKGVMGVPISFLDKYNPDQFEIIGTTKAWLDFASKTYPPQIQINPNGQSSTVTKLNDGATLRLDSPPNNKTYYLLNKQYYIQVYNRILIKHKGKQK